VGRDVEQDDEVGPAAPDRPLVDGSNLLERQSPAVPLVGQRRVHAAIADHVTTGREHRLDQLLEMLRPVGRDE
jgi:hypothetical protein